MSVKKSLFFPFLIKRKGVSKSRRGGGEFLFWIQIWRMERKRKGGEEGSGGCKKESIFLLCTQKPLLILATPTHVLGSGREKAEIKYILVGEKGLKKPKWPELDSLKNGLFKRRIYFRLRPRFIACVQNCGVQRVSSQFVWQNVSSVFNHRCRESWASAPF